MKSSSLLLSIIVLLLVLSSSGKVQVLTDENYKEKISKGFWLLKYYAPWCGHCKTLAPTWEQASTKLKGTVNVGHIDCTQHKVSCTGIKGYPTLKAKLDGEDELLEYRSGRDLDSIVTYAKSLAKPAVITLSETKKEELGELAFVLVDKKNDEKIKSSFSKVAMPMKMLIDFIVDDVDFIKDKFKVDSGVNAAMYVVKDDYIKEYKGDLNDATLMKQWMITHSYPLIPDLGKFSQTLQKSEKRLILLISDAKATNTAKFKMNAKSVAKKWLEEGEKWDNYLIVDVDFSKFNRFVHQNFGIAENELPQLVVWEPATKYYYLNKKELQTESIPDVEEFVAGIIEGKIAARGGMWENITRNVRISFDNVSGFFFQNPILASVLALLPTLAITGLCYLLCCFDPDTDEEDNVPTKTEKNKKED